MATVIYKYKLRIDREAQNLPIRRSEQVLHVAMQNSELCLWAAVDDSRVRIGDRYFCVVGTGHEWPENTVYVGTVMYDQFVWHVLEVLINAVK